MQLVPGSPATGVQASNFNDQKETRKAEESSSRDKEFHVMKSLQLNFVSEDEKKTQLIKGGPENAWPLVGLVLCTCLIICFVSVFGAAVNAEVYQLKTKSVCATDTLRCTCDLNNGEWPIATRAFYGNQPYTAAAADWYQSTQGWVFDPVRGICPLGAVQVWVTLAGTLKWQGTLQQYRDDYSGDGDTNVPQRRLTATGAGDGDGEDEHFQPEHAADFLLQNTDSFSAVASDLSELAHSMMVKVGASSEKAALEFNIGEAAPAGYHRQLKIKSSSSSSNSKPKRKTFYNYRFCLRKEYSDEIKQIWATADTANAATGAVTDGRSFTAAYSDYLLGKTLVTVSVVFATVMFFPFVFLFFYALKYEYTGHGGPKFMGKGLFPFSAAFAIVVVFVVLAAQTVKAIDKNDFLSMPLSGWAPFMPGCSFAVETSTASSLTGASMGIGISVVAIMALVFGHYIYRRLQPKSPLDIHEESLMMINPNVPFMLDSVKPAVDGSL